MPLTTASRPRLGSTRARFARRIGQHGTTVLVAALTAMVVAAGPTVAATVVSLAKNAYAVDGLSATKYTTSKTTRKNKLVATNSSGYLPSNIVLKIQNSDKLDGLDSTAFLGASAKAADAQLLDGLDSTAFLGATATATNSGKLDGLDSSDFVQGSARVVHLQGDSTDAANGSALVAAVAAITDAAATKQYVIVLEPGTYDIGTQELALPAFVHLRGAGMTATMISGTGSTTASGSACGTLAYSCVLQLNGLSEVRDLQVRNTGGADGDGSYRIAIYSNASGATLRAVHAFATGVLYTLTGPSAYRVGVLVTGAPPVIVDSYLQSKDGYNNRALWTFDTNGQTMRVEDTRIISTGAGVDYSAVYASAFESTSVINVRDSFLSGQNVDVNVVPTSTVRIANSLIAGDSATGGGTLTCFGTYTSTFTATTGASCVG